MRLFTLFLIVALAEMATFFWVESQIGLGWALGLAVATALLGGVLVRGAGLTVLRSIQRKVGEGQLPGRELTHGAAILVAGAFLISPGFITDTFGFLLLVPAVRDVIHRIVSRRLAGRFRRVNIRRGPGPGADVLAWDFDEDVIDVEGSE